MTSSSSDFGWRSETPACSTPYITEPVISELKRLGARRVLDLGCGNGAVSHLFQSAGFEVLGCDVDQKGIDFAQRGNSGARFKCIGLYDDPLSLNEKDFDAVVSTEVVEHLFDPKALPRFAGKVLKPGGHLILTTPYHGYLKNVLISLLGKWDWHHSPLHDGGHIKFWSYRTISVLLEQNGFSVQRFIGAGRFPLLWKSMVITAELHRVSAN